MTDLSMESLFVMGNGSVVNPITRGGLDKRCHAEGGVLIQSVPWKTPPAVDMKIFLYTILEIHIFKATMQSWPIFASKHFF